MHYLKSSDSSDSSDSGPDSSDSCTKAGLSHLQDALHDTTMSRDTPCMHQDPTSCSILAQAMDSCSTALSSEGEMSRGAVVQNLQTQISPFQSTLRAKDRVERCTLKERLPLLSTFCKFQRLKVKGSQVMLVCLHQRSRSGNVDDDRTSTMCWLSSDSATPLWRPHTFVYDCAQLHPW